MEKTPFLCIGHIFRSPYVVKKTSFGAFFQEDGAFFRSEGLATLGERERKSRFGGESGESGGKKKMSGVDTRGRH